MNTKGNTLEILSIMCLIFIISRTTHFICLRDRYGHQGVIHWKTCLAECHGDYKNKKIVYFGRLKNLLHRFLFVKKHNYGS